MKKNLLNSSLLGLPLVMGILLSPTARAGFNHASFFLPFVNDLGSSAGRVLSTAVKYFLADDKDLVAELIWDESGSCSGKGCGGCYGAGCSATGNLSLSAELNDLSVDKIYENDAIGRSCVADLAQDRLNASVEDRVALENLRKENCMMLYNVQQRAIQAMTDALNMKRLYAQIKTVATSSKTDYADYSAAVSSVASKRLLLDQLLALKKRVVAARVRTRAQTLEVDAVDWQKITTAPDLRDVCGTNNPGGNGPGGACNGYLDDHEVCQDCPENATCDGHTISCNEGYTLNGTTCVSSEAGE